MCLFRLDYTYFVHSIIIAKGRGLGFPNWVFGLGFFAIGWQFVFRLIVLSVMLGVSFDTIAGDSRKNVEYILVITLFVVNILLCFMFYLLVKYCVKQTSVFDGDFLLSDFSFNILNKIQTCNIEFILCCKYLKIDIFPTLNKVVERLDSDIASNVFTAVIGLCKVLQLFFVFFCFVSVLEF